MAIRVIKETETDVVPSVEEVMERLGVDRYAADLYRAVVSGWALTNDLEYIPEGERERVLQEEEEAEMALLAAAERVDSTASVEANVNRTGLDRHLVEAALALRVRAEGPLPEEE